MNKFNSGVKYNQLGSIKYNSTSLLVSIQDVYTRVGPRPVVLDQQYHALAVLENSFDVFLDQEVNGMDELSFSLPYTDSKREFLQNENIIQMFDTLYVVRKVTKRKGLEAPVLDVFCEAIWYDLQYGEPLTVTKWVEADAVTIISDILEGTEWSVGTVELTSTRTLDVSGDQEINRLGAVWKVQSLFGGDIEWDTSTKKVHLLYPNITHSGVAISYSKNMRDMEAIYDTRNLITKLYVYGKDGLTIESANNGSKFIENYSYTSKVRVRTIKDERFTNPFTLLDYGQKQLTILSKPQGTYKLNVLEMSRQTGLSHEKFTIGDIIRVYDKEVDMDANVRIMKWKYDVIEPELTEVQLETKIKGIAELLADNSDGSETFTAGDAVDKSEMLDLMVFNYLLNSRGDDEFSYWTNTGWEVDAANGYSGNASFKANGEFGINKSMKQIVYPSHRDTYALSFRAYVENYQKGANGKVGVNITVTYDDGTTEEVFVSLI